MNNSNTTFIQNQHNNKLVSNYLKKKYIPGTEAYTRKSVQKYFPQVKVKTPEYRAIARMLASQQAINQRFKKFECLSHCYYHNKTEYHLIFKAVAVIN